MPVIAVVNRKGGSGKSTLAAHIAAWCARQGSSVMLGDVDRQQSSRAWLKRRDPSLPQIAPWALDQKNMLRVPSGITHVVLDTPGGLHGFELARIVMFADAIVMPLCNSVFDRESAAACHAELMTLPRVSSGRCRLATVGMRIDSRTHAGQTLREWSDALGVQYLGALRETQLYVRSLERGMTVFDLPPAQAATDLNQWATLIDWLRPILYPVQAANDAAPAAAEASPASRAIPPALLAAAREQSARPQGTRSPRATVASSLSGSLKPAQESLIHGSRLSVIGTQRAPVLAKPAAQPALARSVPSGDGLQIPSFLKRGA
ncbi:MAG: ParA family protein [Burkholderiaceae bacterium]|nr:ParA family protein [Burkholderiaceae bacterium]MDO9089797.1 ParA family protein [Burkholderiaceae bacterium]